MAFVILAAAAFFLLVWLGRRAEKNRGDWRVAATFASLVAMAAGAYASARGAWPVGLGLIIGGLMLAAGARRGLLGRPSAPPPQRDDGSDAEARDILGVGPDATSAEIEQAYRRLIAAVHPDRGGTKGLAARLNAARDRLLKGR